MRVLIALLVAASLAGCGEGKKPDSPTAPAPDASVFDKKEVPKGAVPIGRGNQKAKDGPKGD